MVEERFEQLARSIDVNNADELRDFLIRLSEKIDELDMGVADIEDQIDELVEE